MRGAWVGAVMTMAPSIGIGTGARIIAIAVDARSVIAIAIIAAGRVIIVVVIVGIVVVIAIVMAIVPRQSYAGDHR
jgi:hypothetical protein